MSEIGEGIEVRVGGGGCKLGVRVASGGFGGRCVRQPEVVIRVDAQVLAKGVADGGGRS